MPVGRKDDELNAQELGDWSERREIIVHAHPKQAKRVQAQSDTDVVNDAAPQIAGGWPDVSLLICPSSLHDDGCKRQYGLQPRVLEDAALDGEKCVRVGYIDLGKHMVERPEVMDRCPPMCHNDDSSLPSQVVDQELEECIDGEGLVYISYRIQEGSGAEGYHARPGGNRVYGDHEEDADDISLEERLPVVLRLEPDRAIRSSLALDLELAKMEITAHAYTTDMSVAARDATPDTTVVA